jgi:peroxiredoxin
MKQVSIFIVIAIACFSFIISDQPAGLNIGDTAPDFTGMNQKSKEIHLKELLKSGPVVVLFYRGEWCPYCNKQLGTLQDSMKFILEKGASIVAVTPETIDNVEKTIEKTKASFNIISDNHSKIMHDYKVAFVPDEKTTEKYKGYGIVLPERNGTNGNELPVPAVYIIDKEGKITYRYFDHDYRKRASVKEIIDHL